MVFHDSESLFSTINVFQGSNAQVTAEVDLAGQSSGSNVEPVGVERGDFLSFTGLDIISPFGDCEELILLEVVSVGMDEFLSGHIFNCEEGLFSVHQKDLLRI